MVPIPLLHSYTSSFRNRDSWYHGKNLPSVVNQERLVVDHFQMHGTVTDLRKSTAVNRERPAHADELNAVRRYHHRALSGLNRDFLIPEIIRGWKLCMEMRGNRL
jgi:hypothetical protein